MPARPFSPATAEQVIAVVEAVVASPEAVKVDFVAEFSDITEPQAQHALELAADLGLLNRDGLKFSVSSPLCRFTVTPNQNQKAAILRVILESYEPFIVFRDRLAATADAATAARQTKAALSLTAHREEIRDTLVSLGTYGQALLTEGGGRYRPHSEPHANTLNVMAQRCDDAAAAEAQVRLQVGPEASAIVSREEVILPIANALLRARGGDARGAVVDAGNAVESHLTAMGVRLGVAAVAAAPGINAKLDRFNDAHTLPPKLIFMGKYLGHIRNAADHGADADVGAPWTIQPTTGMEYPFVACSFIAATVARERNRPPEI